MKERIRANKFLVRLLLTITVLVCLIALPSFLRRPAYSSPGEFAPEPAKTAQPLSNIASARRGSELVKTFGTNSLLAPLVTATKTDALAVDNDGDNNADPGDTLMYSVTITNSGSMDATGVVLSDTIDPNTTLVSGSLNTSPLAVDDAYANAIGNTRFTINAVNGVLANDSDPDGDTISITAFDATSTLGGNVSVNTGDGSFTYDPPVGVTNTTDTFTYTLSDGSKTDTATVSITISEMVWYVDNSQATNGDGRSFSPFNSLAPVNGAGGAGDADSPGHIIFVFQGSGPYGGGLELEANQRLIGQGVNLVVNSQTLVTSTSSPQITNAAGNGVTLSTDNTVRGLNADGQGGGAGIAGSSVGSLTIDTVNASSTGGAAIDIQGAGTLSVSLGTLSSTNGGVGVRVTGSGGGSFAVSGPTTITNPSGNGLLLQNNTGTAFGFGGSTTASSSGSTGVRLDNNTGNVTFGSLSITPDAGQRGLHATNSIAASGSISIAGGAISTSNAVAVDISQTTGTTPLAVALGSVSASGGSNGIILSNTTGGFTVSGDGSGLANGSGGTIQNMTGANGATTGSGVFLSNAQAVTLTSMQLNNFSNFAIRGSTVNGFNLIASIINGVNGDSVADSEGSISFSNLVGSALIFNSNISGGFKDNVRVTNSTGILDRLTLTNTTIGANSTLSGEDGLFIEASSAAVLNLTVMNSFFTSARSDLISTTALNNSSMDILFTGNALSNNHPAILSGGGGALFVGGGTGSNINVTYEISNNSFRDAKGTALNVSKLSGGGSFEGTIDNNTIGVSGVADSGSSEATGIQLISLGTGSHTVAVTGNSIRQYNEAGILLRAAEGSSSLNATITGNTIAEPGAFAFTGIFLDSGALPTPPDTNFVCAVIGGTSAADKNNMTGSGPFTDDDFYLFQNVDTTVRLPGYAGSPLDSAAVVAFVQSNNSAGVDGSAFPSGSGGGFVGGAACPTPSLASISPGDSAAQEDTLFAEGGKGPGGKGTKKLKDSDLPWVIPAAIAKWKAEGISSDEAARLEAVTFDIANLPDGVLATATPSRITLDKNGAGYGWFIDTTPEDDLEFGIPEGGQLRADETSQAYKRVDLLTVVTRELGYVLKHDKTSIKTDRGRLMRNTLPAGVRRTTEAKTGKVETQLPAGLVGEVISQQPVSFLPTSYASTTAVAQQSSDSSGFAVTSPRDVAVNGIRVVQPLTLNTQPAYRAKVKRASISSSALSGETVTVNIPSLPAGESVTVMFQVTINSPVLPPGTTQVCNQATVSGSNFSSIVTDDPDTAAPNDPTCTTLDNTDLSITKSDSPDPVFAGDNITYTINLSNNGPSSASNVTVTDAVPANTTFVSASVVTGTGWGVSAPSVGGTGNVVFSKASVANGETAVFQIVVKVDTGTANGATITNTATAASDTPDPNGANNTATATTTVVAQADLAVTKSDSPDPVAAGQNITYTINFVNNGAGNATNVTVTDAVPANTTFVSASVVTGTGWSVSAPSVGGTGNVVFSKASTANGETAVFQIVVNVNSATAGGTIISNTVTAASSTPDPNSANNTATATTTVNTAPTITCPGPITVNAASGQCSAVVNYSVTTTGFPAPTVVCTPPPGSSFPVGTTTVTCTATNIAGSANCSFTITVKDVQPPVITLIGQPITLWPANHKYHTVNVSDCIASVSDLCDPTIGINDVVITKVTSDEPENSGGDGNTLNDIVIAANCKSVQLRAEREGGGNGRVYTITFKVSDSSGNMTTATCKVTVPKSQNGNPAIDDGPAYTVNSNCQ